VADLQGEEGRGTGMYRGTGIYRIFTDVKKQHHDTK